MRLVIHGHRLGVPRDAQAFLRKHLVRPITRLHDSPADELTVQFDDARPRKGGVDQACRLTLRIPGARALHVESVAEDVHAALLDASRRLKRLVEREVGKQRATSRSPMHKPLGRTWRSRATKAELTPDGSPSTL
ncbi:MAG TPA: HPF/RaiA family ribosome-associated protein [Anaeromyxobacteraceae bacterium]|nr:HPF/RaiA family ribosome-associated protein [Anaeromyxobacteraceae bacterium]